MNEKELKELIQSQEELDSLRFLSKDEMERLWAITERNSLMTRLRKVIDDLM